MTYFTQPIGILGGTFDPVHYGHLQIARSVAEAFQLAEVRLLPCYQPAHRELPIATPEERLAMLRCAVKNEPLLTVDDSEIQRQGISYMADTLEILHEQLPYTPLYLILGSDAFLGLPTWYHSEKILQLAHLIIIPRAGYPLPKNNSENKKTAGYMSTHTMPLIPISATTIRQQILAGNNPIELLPLLVYDYILKNTIYLNK